MQTGIEVDWCYNKISGSSYTCRKDQYYDYSNNISYSSFVKNVKYSYYRKDDVCAFILIPSAYPTIL